MQWGQNSRPLWLQCHTTLNHPLSSFSMYQNLLEALNIVLGPQPQSFWFSRSWMGPRELTFLRSYQVIPLLGTLRSMELWFSMFYWNSGFISKYVVKLYGQKCWFWFAVHDQAWLNYSPVSFFKVGLDRPKGKLLIYKKPIFWIQTTTFSLSLLPPFVPTPLPSALFLPWLPSHPQVS